MSKDRFQALAYRLDPSVASTVVERWYKTVIVAYSQEHRHYHTLSHVSTMLDLLDEQRENVQHADAVELAIWFHDVVYDPRRNDNETESGRMFSHFSNELKLNRNICTHVQTMIDATIGHKLPTGLNQEEIRTAAFFLDCDLHILSTEAAVYNRYAHDIRKEYNHFDDDTYRKGRISVLQTLVSRDKLYFSLGSSSQETAARANMLREITELRENLREITDG